jgi:uncharacterized protein YbjT (DUF2867 family)
MPRCPVKKILLTGATGYIGGHLLKALEARGEAVRCLARQPEFLLPKVGPRTEVTHGDVLDSSTLDAAFEGVSVAYFLVHSMGAAGGFEEKDRLAAENFARAARSRGVSRIIYLGGLAHTGEALSSHLRSRQQVGEVLRRHGPQVIEFRASIIIGAGSLSFEMIRSLTERLPVMITPKWVAQRAQPIAVDDVIRYLIAALDKDVSGNPVFDIGGQDQISYGEIMKEYARQRDLRRWMIPVPFLTPRLSSLWLGLVTPVYARVGRKLVDSLIHETTVTNTLAEDVFAIRPQGSAEAIRKALETEDREMTAAHWFDALSSAGASRSWGGVRFGSRIVDTRTVEAQASRAEALAPIERIGGRTGWYCGNALWKLRGWADLLLGGVGMRRGRTNPRELRVGDVIDWWRIEAVDPGARLLLQAEMLLPGRAWLQFEVTETEGRSVIRQTAIFDPVGLAGLLYWYLLYPVHHFIFRGMLREIGRQAEQEHSKRMAE